jgi:hypothetical protein
MQASFPFVQGLSDLGKKERLPLRIRLGVGCSIKLAKGSKLYVFHVIDLETSIQECRNGHTCPRILILLLVGLFLQEREIICIRCSHRNPYSIYCMPKVKRASIYGKKELCLGKIPITFENVTPRNNAFELSEISAAHDRKQRPAVGVA